MNHLKIRNNLQSKSLFSIITTTKGGFFMIFSKKKIIERDFKSYTEQDFIEKIGITKQQYDDILENYLVLMEDGYYFHKEIGEGLLINELIGRYLCHKVDLATTGIEILNEEACFFAVATPNYREKWFTYLEPKDNFEYGEKISDFNDEFFKDLPSSLKIDLLKLISVDLMMEQIDRYARNMEVFIDFDNLRLAPIIDFELAFYNQRRFTYFNPYILIRKNVRVLDSFYDKYPEGYNYFVKIFETGTNELIDYVMDEYNLQTKRLVKNDIRCTVRRNHNILRELQG